MKYRVTYPLISTDASRDFETLEAAQAFAQEMINRSSRYLTIHSWRQVKITPIEA